MVEKNSLNNVLALNQFQTIDDVELQKINGGGLFEDLGKFTGKVLYYTCKSFTRIYG